MKYRVALMFAALALPGWAQEVDAVAEGKTAFELYGCVVCHAVAKDDASLRIGPNLHGLFLNEPREREAIDPKSGEKKKLKADKTYYVDSVRKSWDVLAVAESGPAKGTAFLAAMPLFTTEVLPDQAVENIWHYLRTLADTGQAGPAVVKLKQEKKAAPKSIVDIPNEEPVTKRTRVFRAPLRGSSGRALHVGLPNGMNYTFDSRFLSVRNIWGGGFLNLSKEREGRGTPGSVRGQGAQVFIEGGAILQPLTPTGVPVDFEFKEPDVLDDMAVEKWLWEDRDFPELLASVDAEFLGHTLDPVTGDPTFHVRIGKNEILQKVTLSGDGRIEFAIEGKLKEPQKFELAETGLSDVKTEGGTFVGGMWTLDPAKGPLYKLTARLAGGLVARPILDREENWTPQPVVKTPAKEGRQKLELPAGYSVEDWESPKDIFGRKQLFEPTGIAVAKDGTIVLGTRTAGVWRIRGDQWTLFAESTYECLGVVIEDDKGDKIVVTQKPELTRMSDTNGDGRADKFETVCDKYGFHANYHEYAHGPVRDAEGNYYITLNLAHGGSDRTSWRAGGPFMGSMGGYRGWAIRVTPEGISEPYAYGLRSPAGLAFDPDGRLWYAENQGEYVGSSKLVPLEKGKFYGHLSSLVDLPGKMKPDSGELKFDLWKDQRRLGAVWLPHGKLANSPGNPAWDTTGGKFGVYQKQMFIGDQTLSTLLRVVTEQAHGADQGCVIPFARGLASGVMRPCFLPDGSLLLGQTGRGWVSAGGSQDRLQRVIYDGQTVGADFHRINAAKDGFAIQFTQPIASLVTDEELAGALKVSSYFYADTGNYGSAEHNRRDDTLAGVKISSDRKSAAIEVKDFGTGDQWLNRIYHIRIEDTKTLFGEAPVWKKLEAYYTLRAIP